MQLVPVKENVLINPEKVASVTWQHHKDKSVTMSVKLDDGTVYNVSVPTKEFLTSLNRAGVDLSEQYFAV